MLHHTRYTQSFFNLPFVEDCGNVTGKKNGIIGLLM